MSLFAFDDATCLRLADQHGTPCFAYHGPTVESQYGRLRAALPGRTRVAYAVKANPHPQLLGRLAALGAAFDCASIGELERLAGLQISTGRIFYAGPGKRDAELQAALHMGVHIQAEGWEDLLRIELFSAAPVEVNLRVHPAQGVQESNPIIGGVGTLFGPILGAAVLTLLADGISELLAAMGVEIPGVKQVFYGIVLLVVVMFLPNGIWPTAMQQGKVAGISMAGGEAVYTGTTMANILKVVGIDLAAAGDIDADHRYEAHITATDSTYRKIVTDNKIIIGCILLGDTSDYGRLTRAITEKTELQSL